MTADGMFLKLGFECVGYIINNFRWIKYTQRVHNDSFHRYIFFQEQVSRSDHDQREWVYYAIEAPQSHRIGLNSPHAYIWPDEHEAIVQKLKELKEEPK